MNKKDLMVERLAKGEVIRKHKESGNSMVPLIYSREPVNIYPATWKDLKKKSNTSKK